MLQFEIEKLDVESEAVHLRACARASKYLAAEAELLDSIIEIDRLQIYLKFGEPYLTPYCVKYLNLSEDVAANFVRVARKAREVEGLKTAIDEGRLTVTKAKTIVSVLTPENHGVWIEKAINQSKSSLERDVACANPAAPKPEKARPVGENRYRIEIEVTEEEMEMLRRARELVSQKQKSQVSWAQTICTSAQDFVKKHDPIHKAERSRDRSSWSAIKNEVKKRDGGCCQARMPSGAICGSKQWVDLHHIVEVSAGGADTPDNLITLCSAYHRLWHRRRDKLLGYWNQSG